MRYIHIAVVGEPHTRAGGYPMRQSSAHTIRSEQSAKSVPPPTQKPCTCAITGFGERHSDMYVPTYATSPGSRGSGPTGSAPFSIRSAPQSMS